MNRDPLQPRNDASLFLVLFALLYLPGLAFLPLALPEAVAALGQIDSGTVDALQHPFLSGETLAVYPFYKSVVAVFAFFLGTNEWAARLPSVIAVLGLCGLAAWMGRRYGGRDGAIAAAVTCACAFSSLAAGRQASGHAITAVFLNAAWFCWYVLGRDKRRWGLAWTVALSIVLVASLHAGIKAFLIFYFPLFFLRRPMKSWRRLTMVRHLTMLSLAFALYLLFQASMTGTPITVEALGRWHTHDGAAIQFGDMMLYPFRWLFFLLPSALLFWPGFCAAFRPLERDPQCGSFMRTLVATLTLSMWVIPNTSARDLVVVMAPLAVLAAIHHEYLIRRYAHVFNRFSRILFLVAFAAACCGLLLCLATLVRFIDLDAVSVHNQAFAAVMVAVAAIFAGLALRSSQTQPLWLRLILLMIVVQNLVAGLALPVREVFESEARDRGLAMRSALPPGVRVHRLSPLPLLPEIFYMNHRVSTVASAQDLPEAPEIIHVLAGYDPPLTESRLWTPISPAFRTDTRYIPVLEWFPDSFTALRLRRRIETPTPTATENVIRLYRGVVPPQKSPPPAPTKTALTESPD